MNLTIVFSETNTIFLKSSDEIEAIFMAGDNTEVQ